MTASAIENLQLHRQRLAPHNGTDEVLRLLENRLYENEQGIYISNGLSTELICFPSDLHPLRKDVLEDKLHSAISYATRLHDSAEITALHYTPQMDNNDLRSRVLTLGLYLYFADEASRLKGTKTFLTAMREAGAELAPKQDFTSSRLKEKVGRALGLLQFGDKPKQCLADWHTKGSYTIEGDRNYVDAKGHVHGAYAKLAEHIIHFRKDPEEATNLAISYALGNRAKVEGLSEKDMLNATSYVTRSDVRDRISRGIKERIRRIKETIEKEVPRPELPPAAPKDLLKIFADLPQEARELFYREGYSCAYSNEANLKKCYPQKDVPRVSQYQNMANRNFCTGLRESRYRTVFLCNGAGQFSKAFRANPDLRFEIAEQALMHEIMHMMISYLNADEKKALQTAVEAVNAELTRRNGTTPPSFRQKLETIYPLDINDTPDGSERYWTLSDAVSNTWQYNVYDKARSWEEIACNAYGLMHTEFDKDKPRHGGPNPFYENVDGCVALQQLSQAIESAVGVALERCKAAHPLVEAQGSARKQ